MYKASFIYKTSFTLDAKPAKPENDIEHDFYSEVYSKFRC